MLCRLLVQLLNLKFRESEVEIKGRRFSYSFLTGYGFLYCLRYRCRCLKLFHSHPIFTALSIPFFKFLIVFVSVIGFIFLVCEFPFLSVEVFD